MTIWQEVVPTEGTPAESYLRTHCRLEIPNGISGHVLRFHRACSSAEAPIRAWSPWRAMLRPTPIRPFIALRSGWTARRSRSTATARFSLGSTNYGAVKLIDDAAVAANRNALGAAKGVQNMHALFVVIQRASGASCVRRSRRAHCIENAPSRCRDRPNGRHRQAESAQPTSAPGSVFDAVELRAAEIGTELQARLLRLGRQPVMGFAVAQPILLGLDAPLSQGMTC
jgi:hypothetical protein